jgi:suppressor of ftsI
VVVIRTKFKEFTGKSVLHCHILPHEDTGMMENFLIL